MNSLVASKKKFELFFMFFFSLCCLSAMADLQPHISLERSEALSFVEMLDAAEANAPDLLSMQSRVEEAELHKKRGQQWFADNPSFVFNYYDDSQMSNTGLSEIEAGIQFELWSWKARGYWKTLGEQLDQQQQKWQLALRWAIAGKLREQLSALALADVNLSLTHADLEVTQSLFDTGQLLHQQGAISRENLLHVEALLLERQQQLVDAHALLVDAERQYFVLSGLSKRPAHIQAEKQAAKQAIDQAHPALAVLQMQIDIAKSNVLVEKAQGKGNPSLTLGVRKEQGGSPGEEINSLAFSLSIPMGKSHSAALRASKATREQVEFEVQFEKQRRELNRMLHEFEHELSVLEKKIPLAKKAAFLGEQRWKMAQVAFRVGESRQDEVIIALQRFRDFERQYQNMLLEKERLISLYNQTVGVLP